jgi:FkbM family methyltransferase
MRYVTSAALIDNGNVRVKAGRHGLMAFNVHDTFVGRSLDLYGEWSPEDARLLSAHLRPGMTVLDIGANIGAHTLFFAAAAGPTGEVLAFEPVPGLFQLLCCNLALNGLARVRTFPAAVGRARGAAGLPALDLGRPGNFGAAAIVPAGGGEAAPVLAIDDLGLGACHLMKIDVEGMEGEVLAGAAATIARHRPVLFVENEEPASSPALLRQVFGFGYRAWWHSPPLFSPGNHYGNPVDVFPGLGSLNLLCLPPGHEPPPAGDYLLPVNGVEDWPAWWPDWSAQTRSQTADGSGPRSG